VKKEADETSSQRSKLEKTELAVYQPVILKYTPSLIPILFGVIKIQFDDGPEGVGDKTGVRVLD